MSTKTVTLSLADILKRNDPLAKCDPLTKSQEILVLDALIREMPGSYVRDILMSERAAIEGAIRSDFGFIDLAGTVAAVKAERVELTMLKQQAQEIRKEVLEAERRLERAKTDLADIKRAAPTLAAMKV